MKHNPPWFHTVYYHLQEAFKDNEAIHKLNCYNSTHYQEYPAFVWPECGTITKLKCIPKIPNSKASHHTPGCLFMFPHWDSTLFNKNIKAPPYTSWLFTVWASLLFPPPFSLSLWKILFSRAHKACLHRGAGKEAAGVWDTEELSVGDSEWKIFIMATEALA